MSSHYQIIHDEKQVHEFAQRFIVLNLSAADRQDEVMLMLLIAREKYLDGVKFSSDGNLHLNRTLIKHADPAEFVRLVRRYETRIGTYVMDDGKPIPNGAMVLYFDLHAKSPYRAFQKLSALVNGETAMRVFDAAAAIPTVLNLPSKFTSAIHATDSAVKSMKRYIDLDIDTKDATVLKPFVDGPLKAILPALVGAIETRNGYHALFDTSKWSGPAVGQLFKFLKDKKATQLAGEQLDRNGKKCDRSWIANNDSPMVPVPGTLQGSFPTKFLSPVEFQEAIGATHL